MKRGGTPAGGAPRGARERAQEGRSGSRLPGSVGQMRCAAAATISITIVIMNASKDFAPIAHRTIQTDEAGDEGEEDAHGGAQILAR